MQTRFTLFIVALLSTSACDLPKSVGDEPDGEAGESSSSTTAAANDSAGAGGGSSDSDSGQTPPPMESTSTTGGLACADIDLGPWDGPGYYEFECDCETCSIRHEDVPPETADALFGPTGDLPVCECLCQEAGCGSAQGGGGSVTGDPTSGSSSDSSSTGGGDTDSTGSGTGSTGG